MGGSGEKKKKRKFVEAGELLALQEYLDTNPPEVKETVVKLAATGKRLAAVNCIPLPSPPPLLPLGIGWFWKS